MARESELAVCVDVGSTFTKAALVDVSAGLLVGRAEHPTTIGTDVMEGVDACRAALARQDARAADARVLACSSAGGGLRIAVVGNEQLVTAEAGRRVALSSGGRVVHVGAGVPDAEGLRQLREARPDVVLLTGGTDGGNGEVLLACAAALAGAAWAGPVVVAGNVEVREQVCDLLAAAGTPWVAADNVVPRIGVLAPGSARAAIREMFLRHVIGGKHLSRRPEFAALVRGATPDVVLRGVELLASGLDDARPGAGDVCVVDVGGATTDVYSVVEPVRDAEEQASGLSREVVAASAVNRTVEGDLGMRWSARSTVEEADALGLVPVEDRPRLVEAAARRHALPGLLPGSPADAEDDLVLAELAVGTALRRHAGRAQVRFEPDGRPGRGRWVERSGTDLREVELVVGSGGALRHTSAAQQRLMSRVATDGGWQVPDRARVVIDVDYLLAPAGLIADDHPEAAHRLLAPLREAATTQRIR